MTQATTRRPAKAAAKKAAAKKAAKKTTTLPRQSTVTVPPPSSRSTGVTPAPRAAAKRTTTLAGAMAMANAPVGSASTALSADVSGQLKAVAPTFGQVLGSIGQGVADSQTALDKGVIDSVAALANTDITVVTDVIQHLGDDGLPDVSQTELISQDLSALNFFMPTVHEWKRVILSMDLAVGAFDNEQGVSFNAEQSGGGIGGVGLFWGFLGVNEMSNFDNTQYFANTSKQEASWSQGQVRLDATLGPRVTGKLPVPETVSVGPQITMAQGTVHDTTVGNAAKRTIDVLITVLKRDGSANPNVPLTLDSGALLPSFSTTSPFTGSTTNADGQVKVTLTRSLPALGAPAGKTVLTVRMNSFSQRLVLTI